MSFYLTAIILGLAFCALGAGIYLTLRIFNIPDITTDGSYTLGGAITAVMLVQHVHPLAALPAAMAGGAAAGVLTGVIHTRLRVHALLAGILVMTALYSVNLSLMGRSNIPLVRVENLYSIIPVCQQVTLNVLVITGVFILVVFFLLAWLLHTDFGIAMRATGSNEAMVRAMGVNTGRMKIAGLALANSLTALSGYLVTQYQAYADINMGIGIVISGLASVIIGGSLVRLLRARGIVAQLLGVVAGTIVFRLALAAALSAGLDPNYLKLVTSVLVLAILALGMTRKEVYD